MVLDLKQGLVEATVPDKQRRIKRSVKHLRLFQHIFGTRPWTLTNTLKRILFILGRVAAFLESQRRCHITLHDNSVESRCHKDVYSLAEAQETHKDTFTKATCRPSKASSKDFKGLHHISDHLSLVLLADPLLTPQLAPETRSGISAVRSALCVLYFRLLEHTLSSWKAATKTICIDLLQFLPLHETN